MFDRSTLFAVFIALAFSSTCLIFADAAFGANAGTSSCFEFSDKSDKNISEVVKPWSGIERESVSKYLVECMHRMPLVVARAAFYKPINVYRISTVKSWDNKACAYADRIGQNLFILDSFFKSPAKNQIGDDYHVWILAHELGHLADIGDTLDDGDDWKKIAESVLAEAKDKFAKSSEGGDEKWKICLELGVPTPVGLQNSHELLSEYVAARCFTHKEFIEPKQVQLFLDRTIFSDRYTPPNLERFSLEHLLLKDLPSGLILSSKYYQRGIQLESTGQLKRSIGEYEIATLLSPLKTQYRTALSASRMKLGQILLKEHRIPEALRELRGAVLADPSNQTATEDLFKTLCLICEMKESTKGTSPKD